MQLRWSAEAASDLERITNYLFEETPQHAPELVRAIYKAPSALLTFPHRGRPGKKQNTRELVLSPLPYIVVYRIAGDAEAIRHYKAGVRIGELSFGQNFEGFSRGVTSTTGRFSAACTGTAYAGGVRVGSKRPNVYSIACCGSTRLTIKACGA